MSITRTEAELQSAIETLFRVRAVESPPDEQGARTIWHRGSKGADLLTWVDAFGRVTRQELHLFEDCLVWEKATGVRTGQAEARPGNNLSPSPQTIAFDQKADDDRMVRARKALTPYAGGDKFIIHARHLVGLNGAHEPPEQEITRTARTISEEVLAQGLVEQQATRKRAQDQRVRRLRLIAAVAGGAALVTGALLWWLT